MIGVFSKAAMLCLILLKGILRGAASFTCTTSRSSELISSFQRLPENTP